MKAVFLLAMIALATVNAANTAPSWVSSSAAQTFATCVTGLTMPGCASTTCTAALTTYGNCIACSSNNGSYSAYYSCVQGCTTAFNADSTTKSDTTAAAYANGYQSCVKALNGSLLALSAFVLAVFSLLF
ncbi:hypothetical protein ABPG74_013165 [Tetrahymena malaccensis]